MAHSIKQCHPDRENRVTYYGRKETSAGSNLADSWRYGRSKPEENDACICADAPAAIGKQSVWISSGPEKPGHAAA